MYAYIATQTYTYLHTYIHTYNHDAYIITHTYLCIHTAYIHTYIHTHTCKLKFHFPGHCASNHARKRTKASLKKDILLVILAECFVVKVTASNKDGRGMKITHHMHKL